MDRYLVVIIGAGPAGVMTGNIIMDRDDESTVLMIERRTERHYDEYHRMCAEGMSNRAFQMFGTSLEGLVKNRIRKVREIWPEDIVLESEIDGVIIDRPALLRRLRGEYKSNGGCFQEGELKQIDPVEDGYQLELVDGKRAICKYLIGADGAHSSVRRILFGSTPHVMMPVEQYIVEQEGSSDELVLRYDQRYKGKYLWRFPSSGRSKIGFPTGSEMAPEHYLERHVRTIPIGRVPELVRGNAALVGDAAGQANPLTFGGLRSAFQASTMLADAVLKGELQRYEAEWSCSELADPCFLESFNLIRSMKNSQLADLARPLRYGPNMTAIMDGLLNQEGFGMFYKGYVRKLGAGW